MLNNDLMVAIAERKAKREDVDEYVKKLEKYVEDGRNIVHPDFYDAKQHLGNCYNFLANTVDEPMTTQTDEKPSSRSLGRKLAISPQELESKLRAIADNSLTPDQLQGALIILADEANCTTYELKQYYQSIKIQEEREELLTTTKQEVDQIIRLEGRMIRVHNFIPSLLADEITAFSNNLKVRPECCLTALITALSVCNKIGTVIEIRPAQGFIQSPYLFSMLVAESGSMKSPILSTFAQKPLDKLQRSFVEQYKADLAVWEEKISEWDSMDQEQRSLDFPNGKPEIIDRPRICYVSDKTPEAVDKQFDRYSDQAIIYLKDEIAGLFNSTDKYNSGKGAEKTDIMSMYDGMPNPTLRSDKGLVSNPSKVGLSIFGTIQPEILEAFWSDIVDPDGQWSRFLYCYQSKSLKYLPDEQGGEESKLGGMLEALFKAVYKLPATAYKLDSEGYLTYKAFYDFLGRKGYEEVHPALSKAYSKALGQAGRLILNLHILNSIVDQTVEYPPQIIPIDTVVKGINLMEFYLEQRLLLTKRLCSPDSISPDLISVIQSSKKIGWVTARIVKQNVWKLKDKDSTEVRKWFQELAELGYGDIRGKGNRLQFKVKE